jgi:hypothetical protein
MSTENDPPTELGFDTDFFLSDEPESLLRIENNGRVNRSLATQEQIGKTGYSAYVRHVQYGTYDGKSACLVGLDFAFRFPPRAGSRFSTAEIEVTFEKAIDPQDPSVRCKDPSLDPIVANFAPKQMLGKVRERNDSMSVGVEVPITLGLPFASAGVTPSWSRDTTKTQEGRAELYGNLAQDDDHDDGANSVTWDLTENPVSKEGIFRSFRGIVLLFCRPQEAFWLRVSVKPVVKFSLDPRRLFTKRLMQDRDDPVLLDGSTMLMHPSLSSYTEFTETGFPWPRLLQAPEAIEEGQSQITAS